MKKTSDSRSHLKKQIAPSLKVRKQPVQARSEETVRAIREAAIQVLLAKGGTKMTTTDVAQRAGVSVGTLYQYFPNKGALLHSILSSHLELCTCAVEEACLAQRGQPLHQMASALVESFINAKLHNGAASAALYAISEELDSRTLLKEQQCRARTALAQMLRSAPGVRFPQLDATVLMLYAALGGAMRAVLEAGAGKALVASTRQELRLMVEGHLMRASVAVGRASRVA